MSVLVTGAAGFIGSTLCERLVSDGERVVGLDSFTDGYDSFLKRRNISELQRSGSFTLVEQDILDTDLDALVANVSTIYHLAGQPGVRSSWGADFGKYVRNNLSATQALLESSLSVNSAVRFVYASSSSVYGNSAKYPCVESQVLHPRSPYGVTKLAGEHLCSLYADNYGLGTVSLRFFTVYGPRQRPDMAFQRFCSAVAEAQPLTIYGDGSQVRDFTYVDDIVEGVVRAGTYEVPDGAVLNLSGGSDASVNDVLGILREISGLDVLVNYEESVAGDVTRTGGSSCLASDVLRWDAAVSLRDGLERQWEFVRSSRRA